MIGLRARQLAMTPHAIRLDPQGDVWTTDAARSMVQQGLTRAHDTGTRRRDVTTCR